MDTNKLYRQVFAIGQIYRVITDACPQAEIPDPEMRPLRTYTMARIRLGKNRKNTPAIDRVLAELSSNIEVDDWEGLFDTVVSTELKGAFWAGHMKGAEKTKLAFMRKRRKLTQTELAKKMEVTQKDISRWENGDIKPSVENLKKLAVALDCSMDDLA